MRAIQSVVRFFADCRIKHHASLRLLQNRLIFLFSLLQVYWQGGMFIVFHFDTQVITRASYIHRLRSGVQRSLIFFPAPTFVPQRQSLMEDGLRLQFSTEYLRISSLHLAFNQPLLDSSFNILKLPAHPLCQFKMTNVRVSGVTESAGTRFWTTLLLRVYHFFPQVRLFILSVSSFTLASIDKYSRLLLVYNQSGPFHPQCGQ